MARHIVLLILACAALGGCVRPSYLPDRAAEPYPRHLHATATEDIHVFRVGTDIEVVNATPRSYHDFKLWINQRYVQHIDSLPAGARLRYSLWNFYDERGEIMNAGGFWRVYQPDPVRLVQIQVDEHSPLIGLLAVREYQRTEE